MDAPQNSTIDSRLESILFQVEKPGRYVGGEHNQVRKPWESVETRVALVFPDIYDLGQPNLGLAILYDILNQQPDILAERAYAPWVDMEAQLRENVLPLFSLESKTPLNKFDILGFTLPYEQIYTNVLNILNLAGLPLLSSERGAGHPLIIAGGQACYNPEPMADFIDAFAIGEGEELILDITRAYQKWKSSSTSREELLKSLARIPGVYVPSLYDITYHPDGTISNVAGRIPGAALPVQKRIVSQLPPATTRFLVPNVETVHDRISVEIMRGCTRGCRFCHAGMVNRPVREREPDEILAAVQAALDATGYEQVGLLSLSSSDHTRILEIIQGVYDKFKDDRVQVNLPSLRIASFSVDLMDELKDLRPGGGFTLAPEAATERMRAIINKPLDEEVILETARTIFEHGWLSLKLYFMIGLPQETIEDVQAILDLARKIKGIGKAIKGNRVRIHLGIATFIPKPHTPFQWYSIEDAHSLQAKIDLLKDGTRKSDIKMTYNPPDSTLLESWLSRGDRRLGPVILQAWKNGAKLDAWTERFNLSAWLAAFEACGADPDFYTKRQRGLDEILPWDHISTGVSKRFLLTDLRLSLAGRTREDCRKNCYHCGILDAFGSLKPSEAEVYWGCP
ncbi:MAG: TIGR03960 family B12-binding radical SAM protein [Anaerolineaceae bacterium]